GARELVEMPEAALAIVPCGHVLSRFGCAAPAFGTRQGRLYGGGYPRRDLVLHGEYVGEIAVVALGPDVGSIRRVEHLAGDAHAAASLAQAALEDVAHTQVRADLFKIDRFALIRKARIGGDDQEPPPLRQRGDDVLGDAVDEVALLGIAGHVAERQDGDGG